MANAATARARSTPGRDEPSSDPSLELKVVCFAFGFLALEQRRAKDEADTGKKLAAAPNLITLPSLRRGLQQLLAPVAKADGPCCRLHILSDQLTG